MQLAITADSTVYEIVCDLLHFAAARARLPSIRAPVSPIRPERYGR
jgi:hypothetical protein